MNAKYDELVRTLRDLEELRLRDQRRKDDLRILQHRDVNIEGLKYRMVNGKSPKRTMLIDISETVWGRKTKEA